ncbi:MAG TPA: ribbon-helix-helix domain-containing protein [Bryobacteraceae bacterium]|nr:ribbon-helix-helix domain-containing protein [Bryobacteraceae bacterium]
MGVYLHRWLHGRSSSLEHQSLEGDPSKFMEEAVRWRVFHAAVQDIKTRNTDSDPDELRALIDEAVREARAVRTGKRKASRT